MPGPPKRPPTSKQQSNTNPDNSNTSGATNVDTGQPCRPEYADLIARILSLYNYPPDKRQSRNELAQAGFFYEGPGDRVVCYFCGGGVHSWNATDDPLQEHIKLYRYCQYAQQEYRRRCQNPRPSQIGNSVNSSSHGFDSTTSQYQNLSTVDRNIGANRHLTGRSTVTIIRPNLHGQGGVPTASHLNTFRQYQQPKRSHLSDNRSSEHHNHTATSEQSSCKSSSSTPLPPCQQSASGGNDKYRQPYKTGETKDVHVEITDKLKQIGFNKYSIQQFWQLLQRNHETDTNAAINLILDSFSVKHPPRQESSWSQDPTSLELPSLISVPEEDGPSLIAPCGRRSSSSSYGSTSQCGSQYGYKTTKRDVAVQTESHPKQRGDPKSPGEGTSTSDIPTTSPEPQGATALPQLTPTANTSRGKTSDFTEEHPAILSVREMGYDDERIQRALQILQKQKLELRAETLMDEILKEEDMADSSQVDAHRAYGDILNENFRLQEEKTCVICMTKAVNMVLLPCGHLLCSDCALNPAVARCPCCRREIKERKPIYFS